MRGHVDRVCSAVFVVQVQWTHFVRRASRVFATALITALHLSCHFELELQDHAELVAACAQELYYRRLHSLAAKRPGTINFATRKDMWMNYQQLFKVLNEANAPLNLPNVWLWDMIDEFLYQFQMYRALAGQANQRPDIEFLRENPDVWSAEKVQAIGYAAVSVLLHAFMPLFKLPEPSHACHALLALCMLWQGLALLKPAMRPVSDTPGLTWRAPW